MNLFARILVLLYVTLILFISAFIALCVLNVISFSSFYTILYAFYHDENLKTLIAVISVTMLIVNFIFYRLFSVEASQKRIIAFVNPSGRVTIALSAIEDVIQRILLKSDKINDAKMRITANKKGLKIYIRLILFAVSSIPDLTESIQNTVKKRIQEIIPLEDNIEVSVHITKILTGDAARSLSASQGEEESFEPNVPFRGYRA